MVVGTRALARRAGRADHARLPPGLLVRPATSATGRCATTAGARRSGCRRRAPVLPRIGAAERADGHEAAVHRPTWGSVDRFIALTGADRRRSARLRHSGRAHRDQAERDPDPGVPNPVTASCTARAVPEKGLGLLLDAWRRHPDGALGQLRIAGTARCAPRRGSRGRAGRRHLPRGAGPGRHGSRRRRPRSVVRRADLARRAAHGDPGGAGGRAAGARHGGRRHPVPAGVDSGPSRPPAGWSSPTGCPGGGVADGSVLRRASVRLRAGAYRDLPPGRGGPRLIDIYTAAQRIHNHAQVDLRLIGEWRVGDGYRDPSPRSWSRRQILRRRRRCRRRRGGWRRGRLGTGPTGRDRPPPGPRRPRPPPKYRSRPDLRQLPDVTITGPASVRPPVRSSSPRPPAPGCGDR